MPAQDLLKSNVIFDIVQKLDKEETDIALDALEKCLHLRQQKRPTVRVALAIGSITGLRLALMVPDDDIDQINPK